ncbi:MAG TPA: acyltransferase [Stellaceae bacterium]|nr:acyltransferase [Stellaceae bacterium]
MERRNNFDALRLLAAASVILSHAVLLSTGQQDADPLIWLTHGQLVLGVAGVFVFFVISGYLVTQSWERTHSLPRYGAKRALRIYPGLAMCILVLTFALGPAVTGLPLAQYLGAYDTYNFLVRNLLLHTDYNNLPGVWFTGQAIGNVVDGPLWSLPVEVAMYAMVAALGLMRAIRLPVLAVLLGIGIACLCYDTTRYYDFIGSVGWMLGFFVAGMMLYRLRGRRWITRWPVALAALIGLAVSVPLGVFLQAFPIFGGVLIIFIAIHPALPVVAAARFGDLSYGLYIYGWPVEQTLLYLRPDTGPVVLFLLALAITTGVAFLSWHLVEKRALRWKPRASTAAPLTAAPLATG